jgi:hypothetical protein
MLYDKIFNETRLGWRINTIVAKTLRCLPFGKRMELSIRQHNLFKRKLSGTYFISESLQDLFVYIYFNGKKDGFFVEIGSNDGISANNTLALERLGWQGICIEPQPDMFRILKSIRKCDCYNIAISDKNPVKHSVAILNHKILFYVNLYHKNL